MAPLSTFDIYVGLVAAALAVGAIYLFLRASSGSSLRKKKDTSRSLTERTLSPSIRVSSVKDNFQLPKIDRHLKRTDVNTAKSKIRTLTLQSELLSMMLKRLFEAEDEGEINREERLSISKGYEDDLKRINRDLQKAELVVTLNELETIRDDILKKFEATLNSTQSRIDTILKQLDIEKEQLKPRTLTRPRITEVEKEEDLEEAEVKPKVPKPRSDVEAKLEQLRNEVLKELEELDKLELEV
jgi:hypothetical protein